MFRRFTVTGQSMLPRYRQGDIVVTMQPRKLKAGDVVVCRDPRNATRRILKRITTITENGYDIRGDHAEASTDSRTFGLINKEDVLGKVVLS